MPINKTSDTVLFLLHRKQNRLTLEVNPDLEKYDNCGIQMKKDLKDKIIDNKIRNTISSFLSEITSNKRNMINPRTQRKPKSYKIRENFGVFKQDTIRGDEEPYKKYNRKKMDRNITFEVYLFIMSIIDVLNNNYLIGRTSKK